MSGPLHKPASKPTLRQIRSATGLRYHRHNLGKGVVTKAVTRTRRSAASRCIGKIPGRDNWTPNWRIHQRRALAQLANVVTSIEDRAA